MYDILYNTSHLFYINLFVLVLEIHSELFLCFIKVGKTFWEKRWNLMPPTLHWA